MAAIGRRGGEARGHSRSRASAAQTNSGSTQGEGAYQNTRAANERQVPLSSGDTGVTANPQGARGVNNPLGGERRPNSGPTNDAAGRNESFGNH
jgi:hypothetical protein